MVGIGFGEVFYSKVFDKKGKCGLCVLCVHSPVVFGIGLYPWGARDLTSLLKARTLDSFNL